MMFVGVRSIIMGGDDAGKQVIALMVAIMMVNMMVMKR
jgi:hypothetical protein